MIEILRFIANISERVILSIISDLPKNYVES